MPIRKKQILNYLSKTTDMMKGSLAESYRSCGKKGCKCQRGELHRGYFFSFSAKGKQNMFYVPKKYYNKMKKLTNNWKHHKKLLEELTDINVQLIKKGKFEE